MIVKASSLTSHCRWSSHQQFGGRGAKVTIAIAMSEAHFVDDQFRQLMRAAQGGDGDAYRALLTALSPRIRRIVRSRRAFLDADDVEDLVQDVLLSVHAVRATYDPSRPFMPWLLAIVRNRLADAARRYVRQQAHEVHVDDPHVTFADAAAKSHDEGTADLEALAQAVRGLPAGQRQAIELLKLQEMSLKEAAAATGVSVGALKVATHRAMATLRRMLGADHED
jgi:RNA polymerase sigma factor (sigma-70 family)